VLVQRLIRDRPTRHSADRGEHWRWGQRLATRGPDSRKGMQDTQRARESGTGRRIASAPGWLFLATGKHGIASELI
jgi:hypothetical protein